MPKLGKKGLTTTQEHILLACQYLDVTSDREGGYFASSSIARVMSGRWTKYRKEAIDDLVAKKWLKKRSMFGRDYYRVESNAIEALHERFNPKVGEVQSFDRQQEIAKERYYNG